MRTLLILIISLIPLISQAGDVTGWFMRPSNGLPIICKVYKVSDSEILLELVENNSGKPSWNVDIEKCLKNHSPTAWTPEGVKPRKLMPYSQFKYIHQSIPFCRIVQDDGSRVLVAVQRTEQRKEIIQQPNNPPHHPAKGTIRMDPYVNGQGTVTFEDQQPTRSVMTLGGKHPGVKEYYADGTVKNPDPIEKIVTERFEDTWEANFENGVAVGMKIVGTNKLSS